jgi:two-component system nitrogen regulation response regulator GlnG
LFDIKIPPLRKRKEDIPQLANRFLTQASLELNKDVRKISSSAMEILLAYDWPGNVRQLRSTMRRAVLLANEEITEKELNQLELQPSTTSSGTPVGQEIVWDGSRSFKEIVKQSTRNVERNILSQVLILTGGNKAKAARMLKIDYKTIHSKVKSLGIFSNHDGTGSILLKVVSETSGNN